WCWKNGVPVGAPAHRKLCWLAETPAQNGIVPLLLDWYQVENVNVSRLTDVASVRDNRAPELPHTPLAPIGITAPAVSEGRSPGTARVMKAPPPRASFDAGAEPNPIRPQLASPSTNHAVARGPIESS